MSEVITSLQNQRVKQAIKLRDRRSRDKQQRIIIDGRREIARAAVADLSWNDVFVCEQLLGESDAQLVADLQTAGAEIIRVAPSVFAKLAFGNRSEGVVAVARAPSRTLAALTIDDAPLVAVLEGIEKPGNVGAILRTADAAGVSAVLLADARTDLFNPNTIRASQGAVFTLPMAVADTTEILSWLRERRFRILTAHVDAKTPHTDADYDGPCAVALGSEADGLSPSWSGEDMTSIALPMLGRVDSLNVSVTAGVLFYEALAKRSSRVKLGP